jgi:YHS domain-containing protein
MTGLGGPVLAGEKVLVNVDAEGLALQGYDAVAFFTVGAPVKGRPEFSASHRGARYQFHSAKNLEMFRADPGKYEPQFGGYCAYGVGRGALVSIRIEAWQIVEGRLLLQKNRDIRDDFNRDPAGNLRKADERWPGLLEKRGK